MLSHASTTRPEGAPRLGTLRDVGIREACSEGFGLETVEKDRAA